MKFECVEFTDHALEKSIPEFQVKNILEKGKGQLFFDGKHDSYVRVKGKTVVVFDQAEQDEDTAVVITSYRKGQQHMFKQSRFEEIRAV